MENERLTIGRLAARAGCKVQTIRYYEQIGLLPPPARTAGKHRIYERNHLERLAFIRHARELGFTLAAVRELLALSDEPDRPCEEVDRVARTHSHEVERRIARLFGLKAELERMILSCTGGRIAECRVVEALSRDEDYGT